MNLKVGYISNEALFSYIRLPHTKQITYFELKIHEVHNAVQFIYISARMSAVDSVYWAEKCFWFRDFLKYIKYVSEISMDSILWTWTYWKKWFSKIEHRYTVERNRMTVRL